jgi:hypothetical protein
VALKRLNQAVPRNAVVALQHHTATRGLVAQAYVISDTHLLPVPSALRLQERKRMCSAPMESGTLTGERVDRRAEEVFRTSLKSE